MARSSHSRQSRLIANCVATQNETANLSGATESRTTHAKVIKVTLGFEGFTYENLVQML
jgi:hypothetical protein